MSVTLGLSNEGMNTDWRYSRMGCWEYVKLRRMRWVGHVVCMGEITNA